MNSFGVVFRVALFGESHGSGIGVVVDGCPAGLPLKAEDLVADLSRRQSGKKGTTARREPDQPEVISGVYNGFTTGSPIAIFTRNSDRISSDYEDFRNIPRPGHADYVAGIKYRGFADPRGGGHFSGRITWGLVAAGVIAKLIVKPAVITAELTSAGGITDISAAVEKALAEGDTIGGIIECKVGDPQRGLGEPFFYSVESAISHLVLSIPAIKGIEFGSGFGSASMKGSENNDPIIDETGRTATNNAGGINGGITNGNEIVFRVAVKPTSSTGKEQDTFDFASRRMTTLIARGRHDTCIALRMPVIVEAAASIALADLLLADRAINGQRSV
ncbi:MAG: chorismate synthase [Bacteroidales bacterium]